MVVSEEPETTELLLQLLLCDIEYRREAGETPDSQDYSDRFPGRGAIITQALAAHRSATEPATDLATVKYGEGDTSVDTRRYPRSASEGNAKVLSKIGRYEVQRQLGSGAFGVVYLATDSELNRQVAIKVPFAQRAMMPSEVEPYRNEARNVASLDHPAIVPVYDVGYEEGLFYVVYKFIDGQDLRDYLQTEHPTISDSSRLIAVLSQALHHAHARKLVHRDIKPANILIDTDGDAYIADFGLALSEDQFGKGAEFVGTPAYMSPEQARHEGHRVDGRSDVFSLCVVFYEMLTGILPFGGNTWEEVVDSILTEDPRPPRQVNPEIPHELQRICLRGLAKLAANRYENGQDLADDLNRYLDRDESTAGVSVDAQRIVPKGLRAFDHDDSRFFLSLMPGPRDHEGLPESIRFWKCRLEQTDSSNTFRVGLLYGPSGCGKSSLLQAGLLPRLADHVTYVVLAARPQNTESELVVSIRNNCQGLPEGESLAETLRFIRQGGGLPEGHKLVIVLDQFEQWLHAHSSEHDHEMRNALRQCDGGRVQCLLLARDDFWLPVSRIMEQVEVELAQGVNMQLVDLFDRQHARKVLITLGRAYERLPNDDRQITKEQEQFLREAVDALAENDRIAPVRLSIFVEMVKGKEWSRQVLRQLGGVRGIGLAFLEETFSAPTSNPSLRFHEKAVRNVLQRLLPPLGTDIKGHMRSVDDLRTASGYVDRPQDFTRLIHILDQETRLITPAEESRVESPEGRVQGRESRVESPERRVQGRESRVESPERSGQGRESRAQSPESRVHSEDEAREPSTLDSGLSPLDSGPSPLDSSLSPLDSGPSPLDSGPSPLDSSLSPLDSGLWTLDPGLSPLDSSFQLTHDYLVPAIREWLRRKQRETRRGRALIRLAEQAELWNAKPAHRYLPGLLETSNFACLTNRADRTEPQQRMLKKAVRLHVIRTTVVLAIAFAMLFTMRAWYNRSRARSLSESLATADIRDVPRIIDRLRPYRKWANPILHDQLTSATTAKQGLHVRMALLDEDAGHRQHVANAMLNADATSLPVLRDTLLKYGDELAPMLWQILSGADNQPRHDRGPDERFRAACALSVFDPDGSQSEKGDFAETSPFLAAKLLETIRQDVSNYRTWTDSLRNVREALLSPLRETFQESANQREWAIRVLADYFADRPTVLTDLIQDCGDRDSFDVVLSVLRPRRAAAVVALQESLPMTETSRDDIADEVRRRQARAAVALIRLGHGESCWPLLSRSDDPRMRRYLLHSLIPMGIEPRVIQEQLELEEDVAVRALLIIALGLSAESQDSSQDTGLTRKLLDIYRSDPDAGIHGASEWTLRIVGPTDLISDAMWNPSEIDPIRDWFMISTGQTMTVIRSPGQFTVGSPDSEPDRDQDEALRTVEIDYTYAISTTEVTIEQFEQSGLPTRVSSLKGQGQEPTCAIGGILWDEAALYCNWLSEREKIPPDQWCYELRLIGEGRAAVMHVENWRSKTGYRLPTEIEWEFACRAGTRTSRFTGNDAELLAHYARYAGNSDEGNGPTNGSVGERIPNDLGLFDIYGNVAEWCQEPYIERGVTPTNSSGDADDLFRKDLRVLRGGNFADRAVYVRSANRYPRARGSQPAAALGFRVARRMPEP